MRYHSIESFTKKMLMAGVLLSAVLLNSCKKDDPSPTAEQKVTRMLTANGGTWTPSSTGGVTIEGLDVTEDLFAGFSIAFSDGTLTTTGTSPVWLRQDTWRFKDESATVILRGQDDKEITLEEVTAERVTLSLEWDQTTTTGGRARSLKGKHTFILTR